VLLSNVNLTVSLEFHLHVQEDATSEPIVLRVERRLADDVNFVTRIFSCHARRRFVCQVSNSDQASTNVPVESVTVVRGPV